MVYLDNAATTKPFPEVVETMTEVQLEIFGNPSSTHSLGRKARTTIEQARKKIASLIGASSSEIIFTSGGTEADNIFLRGIAPHINRIISSPLEHPAVLNTLKELADKELIKLTMLPIDSKANIDFSVISQLFSSDEKSVVVLMHGNNEIGNLIDLTKVDEICSENNAMFFTDAVQTLGHYPIDVSQLNITGLAASAHKFHGPKGVGFLYLKKGTKLSGTYTGGEQEKSLRVGTENVAGIAGMAKALELCYADLQNNHDTQLRLKSELIDTIKELSPAARFNGASEDLLEGMHGVLSVSFPPHPDNDMLLFNLDMAGIAVSAGSACASGATKESHVMEAIGHPNDRAVIRFSFSRMSSSDDIIYLKQKLKEILPAT